jgi:hypothetical protein
MRDVESRPWLCWINALNAVHYFRGVRQRRDKRFSRWQPNHFITKSRCIVSINTIYIHRLSLTFSNLAGGLTRANYQPVANATI